VNPTRTSIFLVTVLGSLPACRRNRPEPVLQAPARPVVASGPNATPVGPNGTTSTTPESPVGQQVQITGAGTQGTSSIRSVPPVPATGCPARLPNAALGPGTVHNADVTMNETWTIEGSPHRLPDGLEIRTGGSVTLAPCSVVLVAHGNHFRVNDGGAVMAIATTAQPIRIGSDNPTPQAGDWTGVEFFQAARVTSRLDHVTIEHAGANANEFAGCLINWLPGLDVQNVTLSNCRGFGAVLLDGGSFSTGSTGLTVTGGTAGDATANGSVAIGNPDSVRTLPSGSYTGNQVSEILVQAAAPIRTTGRWRNPGVRYHLVDNADLRIEGPAAPVLTIDPGSIIAMGRDAALRVGWEAEGALVADGQAEATRIVFQAAGNDPSPGAWGAVELGSHYNRAQTRFNFVTFQNGGGATLSACRAASVASDHAVLMISQAPLSNQILQHARFLGLPPDGAAIIRDFGGAAINFADATLHNEFSQSGTPCAQSPMRGADGNCPEAATCQ